MKGKPPIEKNVIHKSLQVNNKGEIPIEKNISVVDEQGNEYEATYPKRAKGLVKSGRARFILKIEYALRALRLNYRRLIIWKI